jgi:hypothetical protein
MAVTRTTRLSEELDSSLQSLAKVERVSVNLIINRSLQQLVDWDEHARQFGFASIPLPLLSKLTARITPAEIRDIGAWFAKDQAKAFILFSSKDVTYEGALDWLRLYSRYSGIFKADYTIDRTNGRCILILNHSLGSKWSLFLEAMLQSIFGDLLKISAETSTTGDFCLATFPVPSGKQSSNHEGLSRKQNVIVKTY